jgi:uncharacterized membrane protein
MPSRFRSVADVAFVAGVAAVIAAVLLSGVVDGTVVQALVGLPLLLVIPGYALLAALVPRSGPTKRREQPRSRLGGPDDPHSHREIRGVEWWVTAVGLSVLVVPALALSLQVLPLAFDAGNLVAVVTGAVAVFALAAVVRRIAVPADDRYEAAVGSWFAGFAGPFSTETTYDVVVSLALVASVILLLGSVAFAANHSQQGASYSEFYLLTENESGDLVSTGYPTRIDTGDSPEMVVGIDNSEGEETDYTVVVALQRLNGSDENATVVEEVELTRMEATVGANESWRSSHTIEPELGEGENLRVSYYLYRGDAPEDPTKESAYRYLKHWITVVSE